jgi:hypothetical protein
MLSRLNPLIVLLVALIALPVSGQAATEQRTALVIGNSAYSDAPLRNPVNDATDMAAALKELGFSVTLRTDANQRSMEEAIRNFGKSLRSGGVGLFYYAGHGIQYRGRNYLIPVHAGIQSEADVKYRTVDAGYVLAQMEEAGNGLNIIILDACRNNPFARSFRSSEQGLAKMDAPTGSILAYSTAPGSVAADGTGRNGLYTEKLLTHMRTPGITVERLFKLVRRDVLEGTVQKQVPWESSSLVGDFFFVPGRGIQVSEKQPPSPVLASVSPVIKQPKKVLSPSIVATDGQYQKTSEGVVIDTKTGLEWFTGPDIDTTWYKAKAWVESLDVAGGGWRMPTLDELETLYQKGIGTHNRTPLLKTTGWGAWSGETRGSSLALGFTFVNGRNGSLDRDRTYVMRGYAVRSGGR